MSIAPLFTSRLRAVSDGIPAWHRFHGDPNTRLGDHESLVLSVSDGDTPGAEEVVTLWATTNGFSLEGIDPHLALHALLWSTVLVAVNDALDHEEIDTVMSARGLDKSEADPDFRIIVDGGYIAARLIEAFDQPRTAQENQAAFDRRTGGRFG